MSRRWREFTLLLWPNLILLSGYFYSQILGGTLTSLGIPEFSLLCSSFLGAHLVLKASKHQGDEYLLPLAAMLTSLGLIFLFRLDPTLAKRQVAWTVIGLLALVSVCLRGRDYQRILRYPYLYLILGLFFLSLTIIAGTRIGGAKSWIVLGPLSLEPVEAVKVLVVLFLAGFLEEKKELMLEQPSWSRSWGPLLVAVNLAVLLLVLQRDLGSALILLVVFLAIIYLATGRKRYVAVGTFLFTLGALGAYVFFPHLKSRIAIWLNPWEDPQGAGYQVIQGLLAIASGRVLGTGVGLGYSQIIPAVATDFIFATMAEEMGFLGGLGTAILYLLFGYRGFRAALDAPEEQGTLLAAGLTILITFQAFIIMAGVTKLLPLTGVTLPFVSYGGSSLVISYLILGLLLNVSAARRQV
ncbi:cell elongation-specific peptidoglycan biosynthesis regulator RodA [Thermanaeromonas toyohensis ToBE]|uniref:Cell elongation-specific peptidoglycan biosynthesis regulator RodA n=1 Tax=Thermanaeromonas toyohensis ToBE TaxID=698762 RepID=A0A1W1VMS1_9FIRM|nr:FtsW/RodA/SpoVE family cell cycle protein [Thermanaeromonas toyohensis]SMB94662.1 cell elongation-specific peptidoglycan biosynthesis regulator RodA [Thermanaeromonas toyohensis ToBE]